jgi:hypothetical protein
MVLQTARESLVSFFHVFIRSSGWNLRAICVFSESIGHTKLGSRDRYQTTEINKNRFIFSKDVVCYFMPYYRNDTNLMLSIMVICGETAMAWSHCHTRRGFQLEEA